MKISIKNLGPIKSADFNLNTPLTIFSGPNNSGKTYVAFLIYSLFKSSLKFYRKGIGSSLVLELLKEKSAKYVIDIDETWDYRETETKNITSSLDSVFGVSSDVAKDLFSSFSVQISQTKIEFKKSIENMVFNTSVKINEFHIDIIKKRGNKFIELKSKDNIITKENIELSEMFLKSKILSLVGFYPFTTSHILPVERNSIYTFSKELSIQKQDFLDRALELSSNKKTDPLSRYLSRSTRYPMPIKDGLEIAEDLTNYSKKKSKYFELAEELEDDLLNGKMVLTEDGKVQFSSNKAKGKNIPIHLSASIVKSLSSFVFYLKYIAEKNDLVVIDEPELNLHPNTQVILTRFFAKLINRGFRLLISTHSDYIIRELNNLIMLSSTKPGVAELAKKLNYEDDVKLKKDNVSAYIFNYENSKSRNITVKEIEVTDSGFEVSTIDDTIDKQNNISEQLFLTMKYGNESDE